MNGASKKRLYLKKNVQVEPLVDQWYVWMHLIPPATRVFAVRSGFAITHCSGRLDGRFSR